MHLTGQKFIVMWSKWNMILNIHVSEVFQTCSGLVEAVSAWMPKAWQQNKSVLSKLSTVNRCVLSGEPCARFQSTASSRSPGSCILWSTHWGFRGCRPKWPLRFHQTHLPTLPYILLRVINYAGKPLALRGKIAATIWRQPQFLPNLFHICTPAAALRIPCNAYKVSILHL